METTLLPPNALWPLPKRIAFRLFFCFFTVYIFPFPLSFLPWEPLTDWYYEMWRGVGVWVGKNVLYLPKEITVFTNGSGDTIFDYAQMFCFLALAVAGTIVWSVFDHKRLHYRRLYQWLWVFVRYYLAFFMISYGLAKVFKTQFPFPAAGTLLQAYGDSSPMRLAWTFMGYSWGYNIFTGGAEVLGGVLLLFRRSSLLGALVSVGVMSNVTVMNFCYDIPVKLFSSVLLLMAFFLAAKDARRLSNFFILNKPAPAADLPPLFAKKKWKIGGLVVKSLLVLGMLGPMLSQQVEYFNTFGDAAPKTRFDGAFEVETFVLGNDTLPPLTTDTVRWRRVNMAWGSRFSIRTMRDSTDWFDFKDDSVRQTLRLTARFDSTRRYEMAYQFPAADIMTLRGQWEKDTIAVKMKKLDTRNFLLVRRGFHWVNEYPFNR